MGVAAAFFVRFLSPRILNYGGLFQPGVYNSGWVPTPSPKWNVVGGKWKLHEA